MTYHITDQIVGHQKIAETSTTQKHPLGTIARAYDPDYGEGEFIYLLGVASTALGSWVTYNADNFGTALLVADAKGPVAVAMSANVADQYGWYQISGKAVGLCKTGFADNGRVFATASVGKVDDASVTGDRVNVAKGASAYASGFADFEIHRPWVDDNTSLGG